MQALTGLPSGPAIVLCLCVGVRLAQAVVAHAPIRVAYLGVDGSGYIVPVDVLSCVLAISGSGLSMGFFWTPFTYIFLHGSVSHLVLNMIGLLAFGPQLQRVFGRGAFWFVFLLGGAIGGIGWALCNGFSSLVPCVGASGAVLALAGAYGVLLPRDEFQLIFPVPLVLKARTLVAVLFALNVIELLFVVSQTAYLAHLFGIAGGIGAGLWLRRRTPHTPIFS